MIGRFIKPWNFTTTAASANTKTFTTVSNADVENIAFANTAVEIEVVITASASNFYAYSYRNIFTFNLAAGVLTYKASGTAQVAGNLSVAPTIAMSVVSSPAATLSITPGDALSTRWDVEMRVRMYDSAI